MEAETRFLNVDLDLRSKADLTPLLQALGREVFALHAGRIGSRYCLRVELSRREPRSPDEAIRRFCREIESLPALPKKLWKNASIREFNIGIQAGEKPFSTEWMLEAATLRSVASLGARIGVTIYSPTIDES